MTENRNSVESLKAEVEKLNARIRELEAIEKRHEETERRLEESQSLYRLLAANVNDVIFTMDSELNHIYVSPSIEKQRGFTPEEFMNLNFEKTLAPASYEFCRNLFLEKLAALNGDTGDSDDSATLELELKRRDGSTFWGEVKVTFLPRPDGGAMIIGVTRDISRRKQAEEERERLLRRQSVLLENMPAFIFLKDRERRYTAVNRTYLQMLPKIAGNPINKKDSDFYPPDFARRFEEEDRKVLEEGGTIRKEEFVRLRDGQRVEMAITVLPVRNSQGIITGLVGIGFDITSQKDVERRLENYALELAQKNEKLEHLMEEVRSLSLRDELTGLYNRRGFMTLAEQQLKMSNRSGREFHIFFFDLDRMKYINDTYGHQEGDNALKDAAEAIKCTFRDSDVIARIGGDEFVVLTVRPEVDVEDFKHRLQMNLDKKCATGDRPFDLSLSLGVTGYDPNSPRSIEKLLERADSLMYKDKKSKYGS